MKQNFKEKSISRKILTEIFTFFVEIDALILFTKSWSDKKRYLLKKLFSNNIRLVLL